VEDFSNFFFDSITSNFIARVTLSTIVISAVCAVLERGFKSNVIIFFFAFFKAIVLSPSSKGIKTTSAENIPFLSTILLALSIPNNFVDDFYLILKFLLHLIF
jgi:hypothetical protein